MTPGTPSPAVLTATRWAAVALSAGTFAFLFPAGAWRADNPFLVPDLILCALLLAAAAVRGRLAAPALLFALGLSAGILTASVSSYAVEGRLGAASLLAVVAAVATAGLLVRGLKADTSRA